MTSPDILFIVLDTQRADRLGCYGHSRPITPHLDKFAAEGALFEQAISPAQWTIPSHASLFTGLYPTAHGVTQSAHALNDDRPHLVEIMRRLGYETVGFCNNPLVGVLNNGFKRGFSAFYNYGGAFPSLPRDSNPWPWPINHVAEAYTQFLRRISYPIQNFFGQSDLAFRVSLHAFLTPIWSKMANFKGQNERSVDDVVTFLEEREQQRPDRPLFLFLNLMETHLPFWPPGEFIDRVAPYFRDSREARTILRTWNREAYRWAAPLAAPMSELESRVLNDLYDAEVTYQDDYLGRLFDALGRRTNGRETLTVIVADHGDGLGDHGYFGHGFVAYQELVHVPLILHWPARVAPARLAEPVSTRRVYHTLLDAAAQTTERAAIAAEVLDSEAANVRRLSLRHTLRGRDPEQHTAYSEIYPPMNFVKAIESRQPELLHEFRCLSMRRAVVRPARSVDRTTPHKLIHVDDTPDEFFDLNGDPRELTNLLDRQPATVAAFDLAIDQMVQRAERQQAARPAGAAEAEADELLQQRLRGLGYLE